MRGENQTAICFHGPALQQVDEAPHLGTVVLVAAERVGRSVYDNELSPELSNFVADLLIERGLVGLVVAPEIGEDIVSPDARHEMRRFHVVHIGIVGLVDRRLAAP